MDNYTLYMIQIIISPITLSLQSFSICLSTKQVGSSGDTLAWWVQISAWTPAIITEVLHGFPLVDTKILP